ncbi:MAG: hypothetical protein RR313_12655 [Anaerovoracaceae bacterium]
MPTPFTDIYCQNYVIKSDKRLAKLSPPNLLALNWKYLRYAISYFLKDDYPSDGQTEPKVSRYIPFSQNCYTYTADGIETIFTLGKPKIVDGVLYITSTVNDEITVVDDSQYSYDNLTNSVIFKTAPYSGEIIEIVDYNTGNFLDELDELEVTILSEGCSIPYLQESQSRQSLLQMAISGQLKIHSQAEQLKQIGIIVQNQINYVDRLIMNYSYRYNQNNYTGLRGNV